MRKKSLLAFAVCATAIGGMNAGTAYAAGQVERGPEHANSICSFSGQNDTPDAEFPEGGRVQSYGQLVRLGVITPSQVTSGPPSPGFFCNGHRFPLQEGAPEE